MDNSMDFWDMFDGYVMVHGGYIYIGPTLRGRGPPMPQGTVTKPAPTIIQCYGMLVDNSWITIGYLLVMTNI